MAASFPAVMWYWLPFGLPLWVVLLAVFLARAMQSTPSG